MAHILNTLDRKLFVLGSYPEYESRMELERRIVITRILRAGSRAILPSDDIPKKLILDRKRNRLPDIFKTINGMLVFSKPAVELIESLDPNKHQFFPIELSWQSGTPFQLENSFFVANIFASKRSVDLSRSPVQRFKEGYRVDGFNKSPIFFQSSCLEGANLWREDDFLNALFASSRLLEAFSQEKLRVFRSGRKSVIGEEFK